MKECVISVSFPNQQVSLIEKYVLVYTAKIVVNREINDCLQKHMLLLFTINQKTCEHDELLILS